MQEMLLIIQLFLAAGLIAMVLLQRAESDGFGLGSGGSNFLSGRATANLMTRTTAILAALFMLNSLILSIVAAHKNEGSITDSITQQQEQQAPVATKEVAPAADAKKDAPEVPKLPVNTAPEAAKAPAVAPIKQSEKSEAAATKSVESGTASDKKPKEK